MVNIAKAATIALAVVGGLTLCTLFGVFVFNLCELFERVDDLEEEVAKYRLSIKVVKQNGSAD